MILCSWQDPRGIRFSKASNQDGIIGTFAALFNLKKLQTS
jgi:hypothetical protein